MSADAQIELLPYSTAPIQAAQAGAPHAALPPEAWRAMALPAMSALERELFGASAWSRAMICQELTAPARYYWLAVETSGAAEAAAQASATAQAVSAEAVASTLPAQCPHAQHVSPALQPHMQRVIGYAGYWYDGQDAEIMTLAVARTSQGKGIGKCLLQAMTQSAASLGAQRMLLEVRVDNAPALALYDSAGFKRIGLRKRYYQPENVDAYTMALTLSHVNTRTRTHTPINTDMNTSTHTNTHTDTYTDTDTQR